MKVKSLLDLCISCISKELAKEAIKVHQQFKMLSFPYSQLKGLQKYTFVKESTLLEIFARQLPLPEVLRMLVHLKAILFLLFKERA